MSEMSFSYKKSSVFFFIISESVAIKRTLILDKNLLYSLLTLYGTYFNFVFTSCGKRYMCLKLSIANTGKSLSDLPRWCRGWENFLPSAVRKLMPPGIKMRKKSWNTHFQCMHGISSTDWHNTLYFCFK